MPSTDEDRRDRNRRLLALLRELVSAGLVGHAIARLRGRPRGLAVVITCAVIAALAAAVWLGWLSAVTASLIACALVAVGTWAPALFERTSSGPGT